MEIRQVAMYNGSVRISDQDRLNTLERLATEEGQKTEVFRGLLDIAAEAQTNGIVADDQTTIDAIRNKIANEGESPEKTNLTNTSKLNQFSELDLGHKESIDPYARSDWDDVLKQTHNERLPVVEGWLRYFREEQNRVAMSQDELEQLLTSHDTLNASGTTARNYISKMVSAGVIRAHPGNDPNIWTREYRTEIRLRLAGRWDTCSTLDELSEVRQKVYGVPMKEVLKPESTYSALVGRSNPDYLLSDDEYRNELWTVLSAAMNSIACLDNRQTAAPGQWPDGMIRGKLKEGDHARAWAFVVSRILSVSKRYGVWSSPEVDQLKTLRDRALRSKGEETDEYDDFLRLWKGFDVEFEESTGNSETYEDRDMSVSKAVDWLHLDSANVDNETIVEAYRERIGEEHPDVSDRENAEERFKAIRDAKAVLLQSSSTQLDSS